MTTKFLTFITLFFLPFLLNAQIFVNQNANGTGDGSSWENAFTDLNLAIQSASVNDPIWVAEGTYYPSTNGNTAATFAITQGLKLYGGFAGTENAIEERQLNENSTILSGDYNNDDAVTVTTNPLEITFSNRFDNAERVVSASNVSGLIILDGFTIKGGDHPSTGGGIVASPDGVLELQILNCHFENNFGGSSAGAIRLGASANEVLNFNMENSSAVNNKCSGGSGAKGGVMWVTGSGTSNLDFLNCYFSQNHSPGRAGVNTYDLDVSARYVNCIFEENEAGSGGANFENGSGTVDYRNCTFYKNISYNNEASVIYNFGGFGDKDIKIYNCIFFENGERPLQGQTGNAFSISNTILDYADFNELQNDAFGSTDLGSNLFATNPLFIDVPNSNFNLAANSPAINIGENGLAISAQDHTGQIARIVDGTVDLGALEYHLPLGAVVNDAIICFGETEGSAEVTPDNYAPFDYNWGDPNISGSNPNNLPAGTNTVTVTNSIGDQVEITFTLIENTEITADITVTESSGAADGTATVDVNGGTAPYTYEWNTTPVQNGPTASGLAPDTYTVTITDDNNCQLIVEIEVNLIDAIISIDKTEDIKIGPNPFSDEIKLNFSSNLVDELNVILIHDAAGKLILQQSIRGEQTLDLELNDLSIGIYFMEIRGKEKTYTAKLVKI